MTQAADGLGRRVLVCHGAIVARDAIGNDVAGMVAVLAREGEVAVFGEHVGRTDLPQRDRAAVDELVASPANTIIYHHSIEWPLGEEILRKARARIVIKYHNITPEHFFAGHHRTLEAMCRRGREQTARLRAALPEAHWLADSAFNLVDAGIVPDPAAVVPPFHRIEDWQRTAPAPEVLAALKDGGGPNLLAIGRLVPNKGFHTLVDAVAYYRRYHGRRVRLNVVGAPTGGEDRYRDALIRRIGEHGLDRHVRLLGQVTDEELLALYLGSDYLVCASEHEGFCLPLIEAQALRLPIVATDVPGVRETAGDAQLLVDGGAPEIAEGVAMLAANPEHRRVLIEGGLENFERRFRRNAIERRFRDALGIAPPPR